LSSAAAVAELGLVLPHYRTPDLAVAAVDCLLSVARADGVNLALVLVDNGSDDEGRSMLRSLAERTGARLMEPERNLGYAGAANLGLSQLAAPRLGVMNPDVLVAPGCLRRLIQELDDGADAVGPLFHWDEGRRLLLPPAEPRGRLVELLYTLGRRPRLASTARRHWRRHARRHWLAQEPLPSFALSGALLLFRRSAIESVGGFDDGYPLYFEETDWLARARAAGKRARYVPAATAVHLFDQSARSEPRAQGWFVESALRFRRRHYGGAWSSLLDRVGRSAEAPPMGSPAIWPAAVGHLGPGEHWVEVSPFREGDPAAAARCRGSLGEWRLPEEIRVRHPTLSLHLRIVDCRGRERGWFLVPAANGSLEPPGQE
jgi:GT2 family glycosyltransferase